MKIALIHHQFKLKGGMESYLLNLITGFHQQQDDVSVFVYKQDKTITTAPCKVQKKNLNWLPRSLRKFWFGSRIAREESVRKCELKISLMRSFHQDIIICGGTHRGYLNQTTQHPSLLDKLEIACEQKSYATSKMVVAHSSLLKDELIHLYNVPSDKIVLCHPPLDTTKFNQDLRSDRNALRTQFNLAENKRSVLFPSTGHKRKGFHVLLDAFKQLPEDQFELIIAGNRPPEIPNMNIKFVGFVSDMRPLYTACDMTILPSHYEPFGLVVTESIACGTPVIVSKFVGAKDLISQAEGIILSDMRPATIAEAIMQCAQKKTELACDFSQLTLESHIKELKNTFQH